MVIMRIDELCESSRFGMTAADADADVGSSFLGITAVKSRERVTSRELVEGNKRVKPNERMQNKTKAHETVKSRELASSCELVE